MLKNNGAPEDKQAVVEMLVSQNQMSEAAANQKVDQWLQTFQQTKADVSQKARVAGRKNCEGSFDCRVVSFWNARFGRTCGGLWRFAGSEIILPWTGI